jgi:hypothetical protein
LNCDPDSPWISTAFGETVSLSCNEVHSANYYNGTLTRQCGGTEGNPSWSTLIGSCLYLAPWNVYYANSVIYRVGSSISVTPTYSGYVSSWSISPSLPAYLDFDATTGTISGILSETLEHQYTITASNPDSSKDTVFVLSVLSNGCAADGVWPFTPSFQTVQVDCTDEYRYIGNLSRTCDGYAYPKWGSVVDNCELGVPYDLHYPFTKLRVYRGYLVSGMVPTFHGKGTRFFSQPALPVGLKLNEQTGEITGTSSGEESCTDVLIGLENDAGTCSTGIQICLVPVESNYRGTINEKPDAMFWYFSTGTVAAILLLIMFGIPYCRYQERRNVKKKSALSEVEN